MPDDSTGGAGSESAMPPPPTASELRKRLKQAASELDAAASSAASSAARASRVMSWYAELGPADEATAAVAKEPSERTKHLDMCSALVRRTADDAQDALGRAISAQQALLALYMAEQVEGGEGGRAH